MRNTILAAVLVGAALFANVPAMAQGKLNVMTTTEDLASIAREVGGDHIVVDSLAKGYQDPHFVEAKPGFILKLQRAALLILVGRDLEIGWLPPLVTQARMACTAAAIGLLRDWAAWYLRSALSMKCCWMRCSSMAAP